MPQFAISMSVPTHVRNCQRDFIIYILTFLVAWPVFRYIFLLVSKLFVRIHVRFEWYLGCATWHDVCLLSSCHTVLFAWELCVGCSYCDNRYIFFSIDNACEILKLSTFVQFHLSFFSAFIFLHFDFVTRRNILRVLKSLLHFKS